MLEFRVMPTTTRPRKRKRASPNGKTKETSGPKTLFPGKNRNRTVSIAMTDEGREKLEDIADHKGVSRSDAVEQMTHEKHAALGLHRVSKKHVH